jgi:DNA mismatch endonuclease (patch repair protein)
MSLVRHKDTKPELAVRRALWNAGVRYRLHPKDVPGRPDLIIRARKFALFVHGCFWHRHPGCGGNRTPKSNVEFWKRKLEGNAERDRAVQAELQALGWDVEVVWECEVRRKSWLERVIGKLSV